MSFRGLNGGAPSKVARLGLILISFAFPAAGQDPLPPGSMSPTAPSNSSRTSVDPLEISLVAIGDALPLDSLVEALGSDIPEGLYLTAARGEAFNESTFLAEYASGPRRITVWVDAANRKHVRLYFADSQNSRYALRNLEISGQMNEMDLEILAQAIMWSLRAFAEGSQETLSRAEAETRLKPETAQPVSEARSESEFESRSETYDGPANSTQWFSSQRSYLTDIQLFYRVGLHSPEIPAVHGPGLAVGVLRSQRQPIWALVATAQWQLPASYEHNGLQLDLSAFAPRLQAQVTFPVSQRVALGAQIGAGLDAIFVSTQVLDVELYLRREPSTQIAVPVIAGALASFKLSPHFFMSFQVGIEAYLSAPQFEFATTEGSTPFVSPFPLRPTLTFGLGVL